jgi:hypothetical protein
MMPVVGKSKPAPDFSLLHIVLFRRYEHVYARGIELPEVAQRGSDVDGNREG